MTSTPGSIPASTCAAARPPALRTWVDADTGAGVQQLTDGPEPAGPLYFTRGSWTPDGAWFLFMRQRDGRQELYAADRAGSVRQLTDLPPVPSAPRFVQHMHRKFLAIEADRLLMRLPAVHPTRPSIAYSWRNQVRLVDIPGQVDELLHEFGRADSDQPSTGLHTAFTADGELLLVTLRRCVDGEPRLDPAEQAWDFSLRDESGYVGAIWRYDLATRRLSGPIFRSNGEQSHLMTCPWDADLIVWVNYLHGHLYAMRRGERRPRVLLRTPDGGQPNHYSWDVAHRRLACCVGTNGTRLVAVDPSSGALQPITSAAWAHPGHITVSPDGRWLAIDVPRDGWNGLHLVDQRDGSVHRLCRIDCSWTPALRDEDGGPLKSELLHPNPSWSPDGRFIAFGSDFGGGVAQLHLVDVAAWAAGR